MSSKKIFFLGVFLSRLGDSFAFLAFILLLIRKSEPYAMVSVFMVAHYLPGVVMGLVGKTWFDRFPKRRVLAITYAVSALLTATACLAESDTGRLLGIAFLMGITYGVYVPFQKSYAAELFQQHEIKSANASIQMAEVFAKTVGFAVAGLLFQHLGPTLAFLLDAGSFVIIACIIGLSTPHGMPFKVPDGAMVRKKLTGELAFGSTIFSLAWLGTGTLFALEASYAERYLNASESTIGLLFACATIGALMAPFFSRAIPNGLELRTMALVCIVEMLFVCGYAISSRMPFAFFCIISYGLLLTMRHLILVSWIHLRVPHTEHGSAFAVQQAWTNLAMMIGMGSSGLVAQWVGPRDAILVAAGVSALCIGVASAYHLRVTKRSCPVG